MFFNIVHTFFNATQSNCGCVKIVQGDVPLYAHGFEVVYVLFNWMGAKLDSRILVGDDCTTFAPVAMCNKKLRA
jgi:hypothetical protein